MANIGPLPPVPFPVVIPHSSAISSSQCRPASELETLRQALQFKPLEIPSISLNFQKLYRGGMTEIYGPISSGRTACLLAVLAHATQQGEICAMVDTADQFDPKSAHLVGVCLENLVWIRCQGRVEHAIRAADMLIHAGGFGIVALDLCATPIKLLNKIPLSYWFRFRRAIASTPTIFLVSAPFPQSNSCSLNKLSLESKAFIWRGSPGFRLLNGMNVTGRLHKPVNGAQESLVLAA
jgi:hypothetical protein